MPDAVRRRSLITLDCGALRSPSVSPTFARSNHSPLPSQGEPDMDALLRAPIKAGRLSVSLADGQRYHFEGPAEGPRAAIRVADPKLLRRMLVIPDLYLG